MNEYDVIVIGGGPAGLKSAIKANENGSKVLLIEREDKLGGILKQCIHDGFGVTRYGEKLTGPEYAQRDIDVFNSLNIDLKLNSFVTKIKKDNNYLITVSSRKGMETFSTKAIIFATGCRERTSRQVFIHGQRPSGIFTAGNAQNLVNIMGLMPTSKCVILGSGDIGLIMARRLTLQGAKVISVLEVKDKPSGLQRNIRQCLDDFNIPLYLSTTVSRVFGNDRLEAIETVKVDEKMNPIKGSEEIIECDALILSVGLIPENEILENLSVNIDKSTKGAFVDNNMHSLKDGIFVAGNCLSVNDLVDYVSENGDIAGYAASEYVKNIKSRQLIKINVSDNVLTHVPQYFDLNSKGKLIAYLRSKNDYKNAKVVIKLNEDVIYEKKFNHIKTAETTRIETDLKKFDLNKDSNLQISLEVVK